MPLPGWPYDRILERLRTPIGRGMSPAEFGSYVVRRYCESYPSARPVSLSLLDLECVSDLFDRTEELATALNDTMRSADGRDWLAYLFHESGTAPGRPFVDLADLCLTLLRQSGDAKVAGRAEEVTDPAPVQADNGPDAEPSHLFRLDVTEVVVVHLNDAQDKLVIEAWHAGRGLSRIER